MRYKLTLAYDGTLYGGWQVQPNAPSIQEHLQKALSIYLRQETSVVGSGRTDAGVHAKGQVAHFNIEEPVNERRLLYAVNALLPADIRVRQIEEVANDFHAQKSAVGKRYDYHLYLDPVMDPFRRHYVWHLLGGCDLSLLKEGAALFTGTHDFTTFANEACEGAAAKNPVRTLRSLDVVPFEGGVTLTFIGNGFLYKMVRNITGTLVEIARGKRSAGEIPLLFAARDRRRAGQAAPPQGLFLTEVYYLEMALRKQLEGDG